MSNRHSTKMSVRHYKYGGHSFDKGINSSFDLSLKAFGLQVPSHNRLSDDVKEDFGF